MWNLALYDIGIIFAIVLLIVLLIRFEPNTNQIRSTPEFKAKKKRLNAAIIPGKAGNAADIGKRKKVNSQ